MFENWNSETIQYYCSLVGQIYVPCTIGIYLAECEAQDIEGTVLLCLALSVPLN